MPHTTPTGFTDDAPATARNITRSIHLAHRKLPFGTLVKVTNPKNGKTALVRVNDRGPYGKRAKIDLSRAAARDIGLLPIGILKVEMEVLADSIAYEYKQLNDTIQ